MEQQLQPQILPIHTIYEAKLHTTRPRPKESNKYILSQFSKIKLKEQFRQVKRIKGFEAREKDLPSIISLEIPQVKIFSHSSIKENYIFQRTNLRYLTYFWRSLLGSEELSFKTQIKNTKRSAHISKTKGNISNCGLSVEISDHFFQFLPQIIQKLTKIKLNSLSIPYEPLDFFYYDDNSEDTEVIYPKINKQLKKLYTIQKISIKNIQDGEIIQEDLSTILSRNKNLQEISLEFSRRQREATYTYSKVIQNLDPNMPLLNFFQKGVIKLQKIAQNYQITHMKVNTTQSNFWSGSLNKLAYLQDLKSLIIVCSDDIMLEYASFDNLKALFIVLNGLANLENFVLQFQSDFKKDGDIPALGSLLGGCKKLKSFKIEFIIQDIQGFDSLYFIRNALKSSKTLQNVQLICNRQEQEKIDFFNRHDITLEKDIFSTLQKLTLNIYPTVSNSLNFKNLGVFLECLPNLEYLCLKITNINCEDEYLKTFSTSFKSIECLKRLSIILADCCISKVSGLTSLWENINHVKQLQQLSFKIFGKNFSEQFKEFDYRLQNTNNDLKVLDLKLQPQLLHRPNKIIKACSQAYKNLQDISIDYFRVIFNINQAFKLGQHLNNFKNLQILKLFLSSCDFSDHEFKALIEGLGLCQKLQSLSLYLNHNEIRLENICEFLPQCQLLEILRLHFSSNLIYEKEAVKLCFMIKNLSQLRTIDLNFDLNNFGSNKVLSNILCNIWDKRISCQFQDI